MYTKYEDFVNERIDNDSVNYSPGEGHNLDMRPGQIPSVTQSERERILGLTKGWDDGKASDVYNSVFGKPADGGESAKKELGKYFIACLKNGDFDIIRTYFNRVGLTESREDFVYLSKKVMETTLDQFLTEGVEPVKDVTEILNAYLEAALWTTEDMDTADNNPDYDENNNLSDKNIYDFNVESKATAIVDIKKFLAEAGDLVGELSDEQIGHDLWLTRNRHGVGFWDRDYIDEETGEKLSDIARNMGGKDVFVNSDKTVSIY